MYKHILVATDGSKLSLKAVKSAANLASELGARLSALYVMPEYLPPSYGEAALYVPVMTAKDFKSAMQKEADKAMAHVARVADGADMTFTRLKVTDPMPWNAIIRTARTMKCDLIVMASHGRRGLAGLVLGSETTKVLTHSKVPVLVVR